MATSNPFGKLKIDRDLDEIQETRAQRPAEPISTVDDSKKKKKVRPEKNEQVDDNEGFEVVNKHKTPFKAPVKSLNEAVPEKKDGRNRKEGETKRENPKPRGGKREFDRHSGTGRGREIAKGGAGGKGTWGFHGKNTAHKYENDTDIIDQALHPRERKERYHKEEVKEEVVEEVTEEVKESEVKKEGEEVVAEQTEERSRRGKKGKVEKEPREIPKEDLLERVENAITVEEYFKQKVVTKTEERVVEKPKETEDLKVQNFSKAEEIGITSTQKKKGKKTKAKKEDKDTEELTKQIFAGLKVEDNQQERREYHQGNGRGGRGRGRGGNHYNNNTRQEQFTFNKNDFPELK